MERRRWIRKPLDCDASVRLGNLIIVGKVKDFSEGGVFFVPDVAYAGGYFVHGDEALSELEVEDRCDVEIFGASDEVPAKMSAEVRWLGCSLAHGIEGIGFRNMAVDCAPANRLAA